jgi:hypothetical protein
LRSRERARELGEDGQVSVQPDALDAADAERGESPLVLEPSELPLDGSAALAQLPEPGRLVRDERVQAVGADSMG